MTDLKKRTQKFSIDCWKLCSQLPNSREFDAYVRQLIRCSSSVGANYRASQRAKSTADFINKLKIVEEETDESMYFLEILMVVHKPKFNTMKELHLEANEILSMIVASINTSRKNNKK